VDGRKEVSDVTSKSVKYLLLLMTPVTAIFVVFARDILRLWMGADFAAHSTIVMQITAVLCFLNAFAYIPYTSVQALGRPELKALLDIVCLPFYVVTTWWFARHIGVGGAALAKLLITVVDVSALYLFAWKMRAFSLRDLVSGSLLRAQAVSGALLVAVFLLGAMRLGLLTTGIILVCCLACFVGAFWIGAVDSQEKSSILGLFHKLTFTPDVSN
jgi:O-antigen/teichoic acid export membrane protein